MTMEFDRIVRGTLVLPDRLLLNGWVAISGERIAAIGHGPAPSEQSVEDFGAALVFPGFIDGQTHATSYKGLPGFEATEIPVVELLVGANATVPPIAMKVASLDETVTVSG